MLEIYVVGKRDGSIDQFEHSVYVLGYVNIMAVIPPALCVCALSSE